MKHLMQQYLEVFFQRSKISGQYILKAYKNEFNDFIDSIKDYNNKKISLLELKIHFFSFLKLIGISVPIITNTFLGLSIIIALKHWKLDKYLPNSFKDDYIEK